MRLSARGHKHSEPPLPQELHSLVEAQPMEINCKVDGSATAGLGPGIKELRAIQQKLKLAPPDVGMPTLSEFGFCGLEGNVPLGMSRQDLQGFGSVDATQADKFFGKKASQNESPKRPKRFVRSEIPTRFRIAGSKLDDNGGAGGAYSSSSSFTTPPKNRGSKGGGCGPYHHQC